MERLIRNVTKKYTNLLSEGQPFYTPDELRNLDIPDFLLHRIEVEIRNRLNESIIPPHSEWTGMASEKVKDAWEQFIEAVVAERRLPASYAAEIIENSVADIAGLILKPRTEIPSILFGSEGVLQKDQIRQRIRFITVNTHLAEAILKYMDRRKKKELDIETCRNIVEKVDERLTQNYSSRDWAEQMEPLYILSGPKVDSELFRIFFDSRDMGEVAHRFDLLTDYLTRERFVGVMEGTEAQSETEEEQEQVPVMSEEADYSGQSERNHSQKKSAAGTPFYEPSEPDAGQILGEEENQAISPQKSKKEESQVGESGREQTETDEPEDTLLSSFQSNLRGYDFPEEDKEESTDADYFNYYGFQEGVEDETDDSEKDNEPSLYSLFMEQDEDEEVSDEQLSDQPWDYVDKTQEERTFSDSFFNEEVTEEDEIIDKTEEDKEIEKDEAKDEKNEDNREELIKAEDRKEKEEVHTSAEKIHPSEEIEPGIKGSIPEEEDKQKDAESAPDYEKVEIKDDEEAADDENVVVDDDVDETFLFGDKNEIEETAKSKSDGPIWQSFLGDEDHIDEEDIDEAGYYAFGELDEEDDDPIMSQLIEAEKKENVQKLISWLKNDEKRFIKSIFNGSQNAYENALIKLDEFESWKEAANYIGKEIFARNSVNMYDDDAVDFTDRLQEYFEKYKT